jgi:hypothetical protein
VGPGTEIDVVGLSQNSTVFQVLLCQGFHHIAGGFVHPVMGRFAYHVNLWNNKGSSVLATLEGGQVPGPSGSRIAQMNVAVENKAGEGTTSKASTSHTPLKWLQGGIQMQTPQTSNENVSEEIQIGIKPQSASTSSPRTLEALARKYETSDMAVKESDFQVIPPDDMRHLWKDDTKQGFWPEIRDGQHCSGCICWRCWTGCRLELPNAIMAHIYFFIFFTN